MGTVVAALSLPRAWFSIGAIVVVVEQPTRVAAAAAAKRSFSCMNSVAHKNRFGPKTAGYFTEAIWRHQQRGCGP